MPIHSVAFPKNFTTSQIVNFLYKHDLKPIKGIDHYQPNYKRVRILPPELFKRFSTKVLDNGVHLIIGYF